MQGLDTRDHRPRDLAGHVGVVGQDPLAGFVSDTVEEELAYGMEQLGLPTATMRKRVEETLDLLGIADLRDAYLRDLSGGQQQRVAIGSVLTTHPRVLVLDEPTSALDPTGAEEVLAAVTRLVHDLAVTVVMAEHRVERVLQYADSVVHVGDGRVGVGLPADVMTHSTIAPPVVELGRWAGWSPLPMSVRDAYRRAGDLARLARGRTDAARVRRRRRAVAPPPSTVRYGTSTAVDDVTLAPLRAGEVTALMGRNGSGKSSLLWALQGTGARTAGRVDVGGRDPRDLGADARRRAVGLVPQTPADLLYLPTVGEECTQADREAGATPGTCRGLLDRVVPGVPDDTHPRDLSEGQRLALVLAIQLTAAPGRAAARRAHPGSRPPRQGGAGPAAARTGRRRACPSLLSTHDVEFVAESADRVVMMAEGEVVVDGPATAVLVSSPAFAPQVVQGPRRRLAHRRPGAERRDMSLRQHHSPRPDSAQTPRTRLRIAPPRDRDATPLVAGGRCWPRPAGSSPSPGRWWSSPTRCSPATAAHRWCSRSCCRC